ncbi:MAG: alpha/beta hydrolase [Longimicrobiales bacterium]
MRARPAPARGPTTLPSDSVQEPRKELAVVLGHGMWSDARLYAPMMRHIRMDHRLVALDFPGHGRRAGETPARTMDALARELLRAIPDACGRAVLVGISTGAIAALHAALVKPEAVAGLVLFGGTASGEPRHRRVLYRTLAAVYRVVGAAPPVRWAVRRIAFDPAYPLDHARDRAAVRQAEEVPRNVVAASLRLLADRPTIHDRLHEIRVPVTVVVGEHDRVFAPSHSTKLARGLPDPSLHVLPHTGHAVVVERPGFAARLVERVLRQLQCAGPREDGCGPGAAHGAG